MRIVRAFVILTVAGLAITGCTAPKPAPTPSASSPTPSTDAAGPSPTPTSDPRKPPFNSLVIAPEGLGPLHIGAAPSATDMLTYMPQYCQIEADDDGFADGDPAADRWVANYIGDETFDVEVIDGRVVGIAPASPALRTATGIHLGSTAAELRAAYPALKHGIDTGMSRIEYIESNGGMLSFEILNPNTDYEPALSNRVVYITIRAADGNPPRTVYATDGGIGSCL